MFRRILLPIFGVCFFVFFSRIGKSVLSQEGSNETKIVVPIDVPEPSNDRRIYFEGLDAKPHLTHLDSELQMHLSGFLSERGSPIATVVVVDAKDGRILALAQGRHPSNWGSSQHTAVHAKFPAASLFKTVVTASAFELLESDPDEEVGLNDGCGTVSARGHWMSEKIPPKGSRMSMRRAYGLSCNSYFAKFAINRLGLGVLEHFAKLLGWEKNLAIDVEVEPSRFYPPSAVNASVQTVGKFAAGFGNVGISALHAAWLTVAIANDGVSIPLQLIDRSKETVISGERVLSEQTARTLREVMAATVTSGTAAQAFRQHRYKHLVGKAGGKTGTLTGKYPEGLTTLFMGLAPLERPEVVVVSIVVLQDYWLVKAPQLAAEAFAKYYDLKHPGRISDLRSRDGMPKKKMTARAATEKSRFKRVAASSRR